MVSVTVGRSCVIQWPFIGAKIDCHQVPSSGTPAPVNLNLGIEWTLLSPYWLGRLTVRPMSYGQSSCIVVFCYVWYQSLFPYPLRFLYGHWSNTIIPLPVQKRSKKYRVNSPSHDDIITTKQSRTNPCVYFMGYMLLYIPNNQVGYAMCCVIQTGRNRSITDSCCWRFELKLN